MILLVSPHANVRECAALIGHTFGEATDASDSLDHATGRLRAQEYSAVVFDQTLVDSKPEDADAALQHIGTAIPIFINFGVSNLARVLKEMKSALQRRRLDEHAARQRAEQTLRAELSGIVTAMLLSCQLALDREVAVDLHYAKVHAVHDLALELKSKLTAEH